MLNAVRALYMARGPVGKNLLTGEEKRKLGGLFGLAQLFTARLDLLA